MTLAPRHRACAALSLLVVLACSDTREQPTFVSGPLKQGSVARVGNVEIPVTLAAEVAQARGLSPRDATTLLVDDALLAEAAHQQSLDTDPHVIAKVRAAQARMTVNQLLKEQPMKPATDEQVAEMSRELWPQVDRSEARRTTHAIVLAATATKDPAVPDTAEGNARRVVLAERIRDAVAHATTPAEFTSLAKAVAPDGLDVRVEALPPIVADGRAFDGNTFDSAFAAGAFAVPDDQHLSGIVKSSFGWHIIYVTERLPPVHQSTEERRALATRILAEQAMKSSYDARIASLRKEHPVEISTAADSVLTETLSPSAPP